jgi:hypothetical protein
MLGHLRGESFLTVAGLDQMVIFNLYSIMGRIFFVISSGLK